MAKAVKNPPPEEDGFIKTSVTVRGKKWKKIKYIVLMEGADIQDELDKALTLRIAEYEQKNGEIKI